MQTGDERGKRRIQLRAELDQREAESRERFKRGEAPARYTFADSFVEGLLNIEESQRTPEEEEADFGRAVERLRAFAATKPEQLACFHDGMLQWEEEGETRHSHWDDVQLVYPDGGILWIGCVTSRPLADQDWEEAKEGAREQGDADALRALEAAGPLALDRHHIPLDVPHLTQEALAEGIRAWLCLYCPELSQTPIAWLADDVAADFRARGLGFENDEALDQFLEEELRKARADNYLPPDAEPD